MSPASPARKAPRMIALATHPVQYQAPFFRALAATERLDLEVVYLDLPDSRTQGEGFGIEFQWDVPVLEGYRWSLAPSLPLTTRGFLQRRAVRPLATARAWDADVLLLTGWHSLALVQYGFAARRLGLPILMRGDSNSLRTRRAPVRMLHRRFLRGIDAFLVVGHANRRFYQENGVADTRLFEAPHFVDNAFFAERAAAWRNRCAEVREQLGVPVGATCFLFVGKLQSKKHPEHLLEAVAAARLRNPRVHALFVGAGELEHGLRERVERERLPASFAGFLNQGEIAKAYAVADALVLPSDSGETWGLVVNEAMACGLPAIVSDQVGCGPDLVEDGVTGVRYPFGDVAELTRALLEWSEQAPMRRAMGRAACARVHESFTVDASVAATLRAVTDLMRRAPRVRATSAVPPPGEVV